MSELHFDPKWDQNVQKGQSPAVLTLPRWVNRPMSIIPNASFNVHPNTVLYAFEIANQKLKDIRIQVVKKEYCGMPEDSNDETLCAIAPRISSGKLILNTGMDISSCNIVREDTVQHIPCGFHSTSTWHGGNAVAIAD